MKNLIVKLSSAIGAFFLFLFGDFDFLLKTILACDHVLC